MTETSGLFLVGHADGVTTVTIDAPPRNHLTLALAAELTRLSRALATDRETRVVVFKSDTPGFFLPHADLTDMMAVKPPPATVRRLGFAGLRVL